MGTLLETLTESVSWLTLVLAVVLCVVVYAYIQYSEALSQGPVGLPYLGYYPFLTDKFHLQLGELAKKYGDVYCFRVTGQVYVHLNSHRAVREAHITHSENFGGRSENFTLFKDMFDDGVGFVNGEPWKVLRKFFVQTLKEFGMGKDVQESVIMDGVQNVLHELKKSSGEEVDILELFTTTSCNVIRQLLFSGGKIGDEDSEVLNSNYKTMMHFIQGTRFLLAGPLAKHLIFPFTKGFKEAMESKFIIEERYYQIIQQHESSFDKNHLRDVVDYYLNERRTLREKKDPKAEYFSDKSLIYTLMQLFGDGSVTVGFQICETINQISKYPEVQKRIQSEIDEVIGRDRLPNSGDRSRLQYLTATMYEVHRTAEFFPVVPSLECTKETVIQGKRIPKGAITLVNNWTVHHDPKVYENPNKFDPSRFMPSKEKKVKEELPISFGVGKRACAGEPLTNMQVLLCTAAVLQHFDLHTVEQINPFNVNPEDWKIKIRVTPRAV